MNSSTSQYNWNKMMQEGRNAKLKAYLEKNLGLPQASIEYQAGPDGTIVPINSTNMEKFNSPIEGYGPERRIGKYLLPRFEYLPRTPWDRVEGMPTEMPAELQVAPNAKPGTREYQEWEAARNEWKRYLRGNPINATVSVGEIGSRNDQLHDRSSSPEAIREWYVRQEFDKERAAEQERLLRERMKENMRRMAEGLPSFEEEEQNRKIKEQIEFERARSERSKQIRDTANKEFANLISGGASPLIRYQKKYPIMQYD